MIYITYTYSEYSQELIIRNVWNVDCENIEEQYISFMLKKASELNISVNHFWLNIMSYNQHNEHLTKKEFNEKKKQWINIMKKWDIDTFISNVLKGNKENYRNITRF